ncbi:MAG TPA: alpha/beta fold hydrolase [Candidatus Obscuribacterales bacterium]
MARWTDALGLALVCSFAATSGLAIEKHANTRLATPVKRPVSASSHRKGHSVPVHAAGSADKVEKKSSSALPTDLADSKDKSEAQGNGPANAQAQEIRRADGPAVSSLDTVVPGAVSQAGNQPNGKGQETAIPDKKDGSSKAERAQDSKTGSEGAAPSADDASKLTGKDQSAAKKASKQDGDAKRSDSKAKRKFKGTPPCMTWIDPEIPVKAVLVCVHGLGLHNGTYAGFGQRMSKLGIACYAIDVRGFGSFMEAKGREKVDFEGCMEDVKATLRVVRRAHPGVPVFILGESMGGAIALRATARYPELIDGLISSVPSGDRFKQNKTRLNVALHLLADPDQPFNVGKGVIEQATEKPELREMWSKDPLARMNVSPKELIQFQHFMNQNHESARLITNKPVLFVQGCKDKLVRPAGTVELFNKLSTKDRKIELIQNAEHLIFEEDQFTDHEIKIVSDWIDSHMQKNGDTKPELVQGKNEGMP